MVANEANPTRPFIAIIIKIRLLKGLRDDESVFKSFLIAPEPDDNRVVCPVMSFLALAIQDDIFEEVHSIEEILFPAHPPTLQVIELSIHPSKQNLPVAQQEKYSSDIGWFISPNALKYSSFRESLKYVSLEAGFSSRSHILHRSHTDLWPEPVKPYDLRRGAANRFSKEVSEDERRVLMGHAEQSSTFWKSYQAQTSNVDIQGIAAKRGQNADRIGLFQVLFYLSFIQTKS